MPNVKAKRTVKLTAQRLDSLAPEPDRRVDYWDTDVRGLCVRVSPDGTKSFCVWTRVRGTRRAVRVTLGKYRGAEVFGLKHARDKAREVLHQAATGTDPAAAKRRERAAGTFGDLVGSYLDASEGELRPTTYAGWKLLLEHDRLASLRARKTVEITRGDLVRLFDRIRGESLAEGGKGYSANRTMEAVRRVFNWAVAKELVGASPCVGIAKPTREQPRRRGYSDAELAAIVRALGTSAMDDAIRLALWTGVRIAQALGARWTEFSLPDGADGTPDVANSVWTIPGDRAGTKNGLPWLVPLSAPAVAVLRARFGASPSPFVFPARRRADSREDSPAFRGQRVVYGIRERSGVPDFRPHDFRRTLNSWLASRAGGAEPLEVRDAVLGHAKRGLEGTYNVHEYADEKRAALERWAAHVKRIAAATPATVLAMPGVGA